MKSYVWIALLGLALVVASAQADCGNDSKDSEEGEVKQFFKSLGCKIQKGAEDLHETAKPWADKIGSSAKEFGNTVAQKYDEIKHKLTDDSAPSSSTPFPVANAPTEKVPLAPLSGEPAGAAASAPPFATVPVAGAAATTGEQAVPTVTPKGVDDRFLFQTHECPKGYALDHRNHCRPADN